MTDRLREIDSARAALLTPRGRGAVATIRVSGSAVLEQAEPSLFRAANGRRLAEQPIGRIVFGHWGHEPAEEVVVCRRTADTVEIHCHGGDAAAARILSDLEAAGCRTVAWQEQSLGQRHGLFASECLDALTRATTLRTAAILLDQAEGALLAGILALAGNFGFRISDFGSGETLSKIENPKSKIENPKSLLDWSSFGLHLTRPWQVVVTGRPNVGKSSLINALLGFSRSIVFDQPGTTRDVVTAETAFAGWPVQLADTAGIRDAAGTIEAEGIARARRRLEQADCRIVVVDVSLPPTGEDFALLRGWPDALVVAHKVDLADAWGSQTPGGALQASSLTGEGIDGLAGAIVARLVPRVPEPGTPVPVTERQVELLRHIDEAQTRNAREELRALFGQLLS